MFSLCPGWLNVERLPFRNGKLFSAICAGISIVSDWFYVNCFRFPVPLSPDVVKSRLKHNYYRSLEAVKHDVDVMMSNALSYFSKNAEVSKKMRRLADYFQRTLSAMF